MLVGLDQLKTFVPAMSMEDLEVIEPYVEGADALLASWLRWSNPVGSGPTLGTSTYIEFFDRCSDGSGRRIQLGCTAVQSIVSVQRDPTGDHESVIALSGTLYRLRRGNDLVLLSGAGDWLDGMDANRVEYVGGFGEEALPGDLEMALLLLIREMWSTRARETPDRPQGGDASVLTADIKQLAGAYRRVGHV